MPYGEPRDDIADTILQQQNKGGALGAGLSGLAGAMPANMPTAAPPGMPQTPAGGVPGSGLAPAAPSIMPMQPRVPQQQGMSLQQNSMGTMPELSGMGGPPQGMPQMGGIGAMGAMPPQARGVPSLGMPQRGRRMY